MSGQYFIKLEQFEGPLDLLLHLIRINEIDIFNIDIFLLTNQYLEYLRIIKFDNLQQAGEFLEMAATLIEIKSRLLLPKRDISENIMSEEGSDDALTNLQNRLIEYDKFKQVAELLGQRYFSNSVTYPSNEWQRLEDFYDGVELPLEADPAMLVILYEQLLKILPQRKQAQIAARLHKINIEEKISEILALLEKVNFALFQGFYNKFASRYELVIYILAILELIKLGKVKYYQKSVLGPLWIYKQDFDEMELPLSKEEKVRLLTRYNNDNIHYE